MKPDYTTERVTALLQSCNEASHQVLVFYTTFLLFGLYTAIIVGATTHEQLLREMPITLPLLNVQLPLAPSYIVIPWIFLILHFNLLFNLHLLARKLCRFHLHLEKLKEEERVDYLRCLHNFHFSQWLMDGTQNRMMQFLLRLMGGLIIVVPQLLLLLIQVRFLAYHDQYITLVGHQVPVLFESLLLIYFWPLIAHRDGKHFPWWRRAWINLYGILRRFLTKLVLC